jgi:hypothetical protein
LFKLSNSFFIMDTDYQRVVNARGKRQLLRKIASEPQPERFEVPSVHRVNAQKPFKDRHLVVPNMSAPQFLCDACSGGRSSGGKFSFSKLASDTGRISKKIVRVGVPAMVGIGTTMEAGPIAGLAAARASSELTNLITGGKVGGRSSGGKSSGGSATDKRKIRGAAVSKLMKEKGLSLGAASKYVKEHGLA